MIKVQHVIVVAALMGAFGLNLGAMVMNARAQANTDRGESAASANRAGLIIQKPGGEVISRCVTFTEPEITGYELLRRASLPLIVDIASGGIVCKIADTGCSFPAQKCFCECQSMNESCIYWQYYVQVAGTWKYSPLGMFGQKVTEGSVNGWSYGTGGASTGGAAPPLLSFDQICGDASGSPASTPGTTATIAQSSPMPTPTASANAEVKPTLPVPSPTPISTVAPATTANKAPVTVTITTLPATATPLPQSTVSAKLVEVTHEPLPTSATPTQPAISPTATLPQPPATSTSTDSQSTTGYIVFGVIVVALFGLLLVTRTGMGKAKS